MDSTLLSIDAAPAIPSPSLPRQAAEAKLRRLHARRAVLAANEDAAIEAEHDAEQARHAARVRHAVEGDAATALAHADVALAVAERETAVAEELLRVLDAEIATVDAELAAAIAAEARASVRALHADRAKAAGDLEDAVNALIAAKQAFGATNDALVRAHPSIAVEVSKGASRVHGALQEALGHGLQIPQLKNMTWLYRGRAFEDHAGELADLLGALR